MSNYPGRRSTQVIYRAQRAGNPRSVAERRAAIGRKSRQVIGAFRSEFVAKQARVECMHAWCGRPRKQREQAALQLIDYTVTVKLTIERRLHYRSMWFRTVYLPHFACLHPTVQPISNGAGIRTALPRIGAIHMSSVGMHAMPSGRFCVIYREVCRSRCMYIAMHVSFPISPFAANYKLHSGWKLG